MDSLLIFAQNENIDGEGDCRREPQQRVNVRTGLQLRGLGCDDEDSETAVARDQRDRDCRLGGNVLRIVGYLAKIFDESRLFLLPCGPDRAALNRSNDTPHLLTGTGRGNTEERMSISGNHTDRLSVRWNDLVQNLQNVLTRFGNRHFVESKSRDLDGGFGLPLFASLRVEQPCVFNGDCRLTRDQHDEIEVMCVVCIGLVRQDLHYTDCPVAVGEWCRYLALHFTLGRHLENGALPPLLRFRRDERHPSLEDLRDGLRSVREIVDALTLPLFGIDHDAGSVELLAHGVGDHQREARRVYHRRHCFVDLAIGFVQGNRSGDGLLNRRDRSKPGGTTLELLDELSRQ